MRRAILFLILFATQRREFSRQEHLVRRVVCLLKVRPPVGCSALHVSTLTRTISAKLLHAAFCWQSPVSLADHSVSNTPQNYFVAIRSKRAIYGGNWLSLQLL